MNAFCYPFEAKKIHLVFKNSVNCIHCDHKLQSFLFYSVLAFFNDIYLPHLIMQQYYMMEYSRPPDAEFNAASDYRISIGLPENLIDLDKVFVRCASFPVIILYYVYIWFGVVSPVKIATWHVSFIQFKPPFSDTSTGSNCVLVLLTAFSLWR